MTQDNFYINAFGKQKKYCENSLNSNKRMKDTRFRRVKLTGRPKIHGDMYDELEELFDLYKTTYREWCERPIDKRTESMAIRMRKVLSMITKVAKERRVEIQIVRYKKRLKKHGLD